jgi:hypothetical protein
MKIKEINYLQVGSTIRIAYRIMMLGRRDAVAEN